MVSCAAGEEGGGPAPGPFAPEILVRSDAARSAAPLSLTALDGTGLRLRALSAQVVLEPPLAFTQLEVAFENPEPRRIEGRFEIALPHGAAISRLALQIGDRFQEGEVVEIQRAHVAYEAALHRRRDPALLERDAGNEYRVRVFPIEARETKHLIVSYSERLDGNDEPYRLHLQGLPEVGRLSLDVEHFGTAGDAERLVFERTDWQPQGDLVVPIAPDAPHSALRHGELALIHLTPLEENRPSRLDALTVLLDTSASSQGVMATRVERLRALLAAVAARRGAPFPVQLVVFDQETVPLLEAPSDQIGEELETLLKERGALGATDLEAALATLYDLPALGDRVWVFSDGIATAGAVDTASLRERAESLSARGVRRIDAISPAGVSDRRTLEALATSGLPEAGVVVMDDPVAGAARRLTSGLGDSVAVSVVGAAWTYPERLQGIEPGKRYAVFAQLDADAPLRVQLGDRELSPVVASSQAGVLLEREWARAKLAYLQDKLEAASDSDAERVREKLVELSQAHRVLTDHTALVVLETERDYQRHGIARTDLAKILRVEDGALVASAERQAVGDTLFHEPWLRERKTGKRAAVARDEGEAALMARPESTRVARESAAPSRSPFGEEAALGNDPMSALGALTGDMTMRFGGLGLGGTGRGGGGAGQGVIGLGNLGTIGNGGGSAARGVSGYGRSGGGFRGRVAAPARVRAGKLDVRGALSKEVIRRIVQRHLNEVRFCYEQELGVRPDLDGEVAIKFLVSPEGNVASAAVARSSFGDGKVGSCIAQAVRRWQFPSPDGGGIAVVTYPFLLGRTEAGAAVASAEAPAVEMDREARRREAERRERARVRRRRLNEWQARPRPTLADRLDGPLLEITARIEAGEAARALVEARRWRNRAPADPMALLGLARAALADGRPELAARAHGSLIDLFPSRADMRRAAGQRLESLGGAGLALAIDSYEKAVAQRPDHPSGRRMLAFALLRAGETERARATLREGEARHYPAGRFPRVERLLASDRLLIEGGGGYPRRFARMCLYWETDATDMNLHVYDREHRHLHGRGRHEAGAGRLESDVREGYGPECFTHTGRPAYPFVVQAQLASRGPMGHTLASLHVLQRDADGEIRTEVRPFVVMKDRVFVDLGKVLRPEQELARVGLR